MAAAALAMWRRRKEAKQMLPLLVAYEAAVWEGNREELLLLLRHRGTGEIVMVVFSFLFSEDQGQFH